MVRAGRWSPNLALPASGSAHAKLVESSPAAGAVLKRQPDAVAFTFNEPVEANFGVIRVVPTFAA